MEQSQNSNNLLHYKWEDDEMVLVPFGVDKPQKVLLFHGLGDVIGRQPYPRFFWRD